MPDEPSERHGVDPMALALEQARQAGEEGEVPVGAVIMRNGVVLAAGRNKPRAMHDPTAHAEIVAIRAAALVLGDERLPGCDLYVTLEPCTMCAGAVLAARVGRLVFAAWDEKAGAVGSTLDVIRDRRGAHDVEVLGGFRAAEGAALLTAFFAGRRGGATPARG